MPGVSAALLPGVRVQDMAAATQPANTAKQPRPVFAYVRAHWREDATAFLFLALATAVFFWPVIMGRAWLPRGGGDSVSFLYPMYRFAAQSFWSGTIPLWNPYQYAGSLFIADNQTGIFYPPNLLLFLLNPDFSYDTFQWLVIWHIFFAGAGMYLCVRLLRLCAAAGRPTARPAALVAALAYMFSGVFIAHIGNLNLIAVAAWLPLVFLALHYASISAEPRRGALYAVVAGVLFGIGTLAGHGQMTFLLATYLGAYALFQAAARRSFQPLLALFILGVTGAGVAAINLLPSLEAVQYSVRAEFDASRAAGYALPWRGLMGLFAPDFYGRGQVRFWGDWPRVEYGYAGVLTLFLAGVAVVRDRSRLTLIFSLSALIFTILALGDNTPVFPLLLRLLPIFPFQVPARFVLLLDFSLAGLAATGMATLLAQPRRMPVYLATMSLLSTAVLLFLILQTVRYSAQFPMHVQQMRLALTAFAILAASSGTLIWVRSSGRLPAQTFGRLGVLLLAVDLVALGWYVEIDPHDPSKGFAPDSAALQYLLDNAGLQRVEIATSAWQPNLPQLEGLYSIDGVYNPLELSNYAVYIGSVGYRGSTMYNLLGTKYVIAGKKGPPGDTSILPPIFEDDPEVTIYLNTLALPRALVVFNAKVAADHDAAFVAVHEEDFDPQATVILEEGEPLQQEAGASEIIILKYDPNVVAFEVKTDRPAYFVLSDIYHPHWRATVNGVETTIYVADYALRAVPLAAGTNLIEMRFEPPAWRWGLAVTGITLLLLSAGVLYLWLAGRHQRTQ